MRAAIVMAALALAGCGGSSNAASSSGAGASSGGASESGGAASDAPSGARRSGLAMHLQNIHAGGALPSDADPAVDHLDVTFELVLDHTTGTEPLTGLSVQRARLVHDDGREVIFGVMSDGWDGRLDAGQTRTLSFHKTIDSASPPARRALCAQHMRLEITLELAGRTATAQSRRVQIECPGAPAAGG